MTRRYLRQLPDRSGRKNFSIRLPEELARLGWHRAIDDGTYSLSIVVEMALRAYLKAHAKNTRPK